MKKLFGLLCCVVLVVCLFSSVFSNIVEAQIGTLYVSFTGGSGSGQYLSGNNLYRGVSFVPTVSFDPTIFSFQLWSANPSALGMCKLFLWATDGTILTSQLLEVVWSPVGMPTSGAAVAGNWWNISVSGGVTCEAGKRYAVFLWCNQSVPANVLAFFTYSDISQTGTYQPKGVRGANIPPAITDYNCNLRVLGLPAGTTVPNNLSYTFVNGGFDNSNTGGNTITVSMNAVNGRAVTADIPVGGQITVNFSPLVAVSWNYSDALNLHRTIEFMGSDGVVGSGQTVFYLNSANATNYVNNVYIFNVVDYTGSAQFVEVTLGGELVGRKSIAMSGVADFALVQGLYYTVSVVGSLGSFSQGFVAGATLTSNIIVLAGSFGEADWQNGLSDIFFTNRTSDNLGVNVFFNSVKSGSFNLTISKLVGAGTFVVDSVRVDSEFFPLNYVFGNAEANVVYRVHGVLYDVAGCVVRSWVVDIAPTSGRGNVWAALLAPFMRAVETVPESAVLPEGFDIAQWPAALIVLGVLAIFSWKNHGVGSMLAWVVAAILFGLGWWTLNLPAFGFALFVAIIILIYEGKRTEREV